MAHSQSNSRNSQKGKEYLWTIQNTTIQLGFNAIDDDGSRLKEMLNTSVWSVTPFPSKLTLGKRLYGAYHADLSFGFSHLKQVNSEPKYVAPFLYYFAELNVRYHFDFFSSYGGIGGGRRTFGKKSAFNLSEMSVTLYPLLGLGFQHLSQDVNRSMPTFNLGSGIQWWIKEESLAINLQTVGKFGMHLKPPARSGNLIHYTVGICLYYGRGSLLQALFSNQRRNPYGNK